MSPEARTVAGVLYLAVIIAILVGINLVRSRGDEKCRKCGGPVWYGRLHVCNQKGRQAR